MITRSNLAEQLGEYQIRPKYDWASVSFFSSTAHAPSRVDVLYVIWELLMFACLVFSAVSLYFRYMKLAFLLICLTTIFLVCMKITKQVRQNRKSGWATALEGPYAWGYCYKQEQGNPADYCSPSTQWPCAPGKKYYGRGPIQISYNYNYGQCGQAIGSNILSNPDLVATDATVSFKTALWFWMTPQSPKPSCHDVITGRWTPSLADQVAGRVPGYGVITNIINGGLECGIGSDSRVADRIGFYKRYCDILGVSCGLNLDCVNQKSF